MPEHIIGITAVPEHNRASKYNSARTHHRYNSSARTIEQVSTAEPEHKRASTAEPEHKRTSTAEPEHKRASTAESEPNSTILPECQLLYYCSAKTHKHNIAAIPEEIIPIVQQRNRAIV